MRIHPSSVESDRILSKLIAIKVENDADEHQNGAVPTSRASTLRGFLKMRRIPSEPATRRRTQKPSGKMAFMFRRWC